VSEETERTNENPPYAVHAYWHTSRVAYPVDSLIDAIRLAATGADTGEFWPTHITDKDQAVIYEGEELAERLDQYLDERYTKESHQ
jgi:hypothetical protein